MSRTTAATSVRQHTLVQQRDERNRLGSLHAALWVPSLDLDGPVPLLQQTPTWVWETACGSALVPSERTPVQAFTPEEATVALEQDGARICRRCDRVGAAL